MPIYHILRRKQESLFKNKIQSLIKEFDFDEIYISSGFFQIKRKTKGGKTSKYDCFTDQSDDGLSFENNTGMKKIKNIYVTGVYNSSWKTEFENFTSLLEKKIGKSKVHPHYKNRTHSKIFILAKNNVPIVEIIGSSNLTSMAYGSNKKFNYESDLILISDDIKPEFGNDDYSFTLKPSQTNAIVKKMPVIDDLFENKNDVIKYSIDKNFNGKTLSDEMKNIYDFLKNEIMTESKK